MRVSTVEANKNLANIEAKINARGGAWSATKEQETASLDSLISEKKAIEHTLHEMLSGLLPFAITRKLNENFLRNWTLSSARKKRRYFLSIWNVSKAIFWLSLNRR